MATMWNQFYWGQDQTLHRWIRSNRLDGFGHLDAGADRQDQHKQAILTRYREQARAAMTNLPSLVQPTG